MSVHYPATARYRCTISSDPILVMLEEPKAQQDRLLWAETGEPT